MARQRRDRVQEWPLRNLREHPRQQELVGDLPDAEFDALVADIQKRGLQHPIEVLPDGTIVAGHQRVRAARQLKWKTVPVIVRHDLQSAGTIAMTGSNSADLHASWPKANAVHPYDLICTIHHALGVPRHTEYRDTLNRPRRLTQHGEPILGLF